jgi:hypothetical protein
MIHLREGRRNGGEGQMSENAPNLSVRDGAGGRFIA